MFWMSRAVVRRGDNMIHYLYKTTNLVNGKEYIGVHSTNNMNDGYLGSGVALKHAFKKYGKENFAKVVLETFADRDALLRGESARVDRDSVNRCDTYNMTTGGAGCCKGTVQSEETRQKISEAAKRRVMSPETKAKISKRAMGNKWAAGGTNTPDQIKSTILRNKGNRWALGLRYVHPTVICPHCGKTGGLGAMNRYHFENCKRNPECTK